MSLVTFSARFPIALTADAGATFEERLEVSLDCALCQKRGRTVVVFPDRSASYCTPTKHHFPAQLVELVVLRGARETEARYVVSYDYAPFEDVRPAWSHDPRSYELPGWGRAHFTLTCPACGRSRRRSSQTNLTRPFDVRCECGQLLYREHRAIPLFERMPD